MPKRLRQILADRSGVALLLALLTIAFLVAVTVRLTNSVDLQMQGGVNQRDAVSLDGMLLSGLNLARAALLADQRQNRFDTSRDAWGTLGQGISGLFPGNRLQVRVRDLGGLLQINALVLSDSERKELRWQDPAGGSRQIQDFEKRQRKVWLRFLTSGRFAVRDEDEALALVDALSDWLDADDEERDHGAESGYYEGLATPYKCRNGPVLYPEELLLVKGFSRKLLYGDGRHQGIIGYLTTAGRDGRININTAPAPVLQALADNLDAEDVQKLIEFRQDEDNQDLLARPDWYRRVDGFPGDIVLDRQLITSSSSWFRITVTAAIGRMQRTGQGVLHRQDNEEQTLVSWSVR